jgi:hypothetical protein
MGGFYWPMQAFLIPNLPRSAVRLQMNGVPADGALVIWQISRSEARTIGLNTRMVWSGSVRDADIDLSASRDAFSTITDESPGFYHDYRDYFRVDLRVYWRNNLGNRRNSTFALDLQNLSNQLNLAYHYYDPYTDKIENKYQLGTIPNFSWKLEF